jgi:hypothetical protein
VLWNTVCLKRAVQVPRDSGKKMGDKLLTRLSPLGPEHLNLIGDDSRQDN